MKHYRGETGPSSAWRFRRVLALILVCSLVNGALIASISRHWKSQGIFKTLDSEEDFEEDDFFIQHVQEISIARELRSPAWILIEETRAVIEAASGVPGAALSTKERKSWDKHHPCAGRYPLRRLWNKGKKQPLLDNNNDNITATGAPSILLRVLFEEYANLHRTCTQGGDTEHVTNLFKSSNDSNPCKFLVVEFGTYGVGNRLLWLASAFQYALLSKRVLLLDTRSTVRKLLCEPFPGSSWQLPEEIPYSSEQRWPMPSEFLSAWDQWGNEGKVNTSGVRRTPVVEKNRGQEKLKDLNMHDIEREKKETMAMMRSKTQDRVGGDRMSGKKTKPKMAVIKRRLAEWGPASVQPIFHQVQANDGWSPSPRFFCDNEQEHLHNVKWITLNSGCLYFLPDLFAVPSFQPALEELFPARNPLTHILRELTLPVDSIWTNVRRLYTTEFQLASRVIGMQVRYRDGTPMYRVLNSKVNERISQCGYENDLLPDPAAPSSASKITEGKSDSPVVVFIASLHSGLRNHLENVYGIRNWNRKDAGVKLVQLSKFGFQSFDLQSDYQAFTEMICLSLVDEVMTSPQSTYGQMAQALGGLTPWMINFQVEKNSNCVRGQSTDACYQMPITKFTCPFNKEVDGKAVDDIAPYLKPCQDSDGLQLVPPWTVSLLHTT